MLREVAERNVRRARNLLPPSIRARERRDACPPPEPHPCTVATSWSACSPPPRPSRSPAPPWPSRRRPAPCRRPSTWRWPPRA
ncbi:hypothetical protein CS379_11900, partial [Methylobacterium frigidaeris]